MDPDLASRLRRFGEQVDQAAIVAQAGRPAATHTVDDHTDALPTVVPITAARSNRRFQMVSAAVAAALVVVGGALVTWRIAGESEPGRADSTEITVNTTASPSSTTSTTSMLVTTTVPAVPVGGSSTTTSATTSTTTAGVPATGPGGNAPVTTGPCPNGYDPYGASFPIRMCHQGPAVSLIQQRVSTLPPDGDFGPATRQSVRVFQEQNGLNVDGLVGPDTWAAMFPNGAPGIDADGNGTVEPWEVT